MECLVQLFHNFQQYQSWKVSDKEDPRFTPIQGMVGLITEPGNTEEWKKLLGDLTNLCGSDEFSDVAKACDAGYENYPI